jgi:hypothetical protein
LSRYITTNQKTLNEEEENGEGEVELVGLEGVEPEVGLLNWAGETTILVCCSRRHASQSTDMVIVVCGEDRQRS